MNWLKAIIASFILLISGGSAEVSEPVEPPINEPIVVDSKEPNLTAENPAYSEFVGESRDTEATSTTEIACSCVKTAISLGLKIPLVDAKDLKPNSEPVIGGGILFYYPRTDIYHVAVIMGFTDKGFKVKEGNFEKCKITERIVDYNDKFITGFIK